MVGSTKWVALAYTGDLSRTSRQWARDFTYLVHRVGAEFRRSLCQLFKRLFYISWECSLLLCPPVCQSATHTGKADNVFSLVLPHRLPLPA